MALDTSIVSTALLSICWGLILFSTGTVSTNMELTLKMVPLLLHSVQSSKTTRSCMIYAFRTRLELFGTIHTSRFNIVMAKQGLSLYMMERTGRMTPIGLCMMLMMVGISILNQ